MIITPQTVQKMGEIIAFCCLRTITARSNKNLFRLLQGLVDNINKPVGLKDCYSDGYDVAQTAVCFLCEFMYKPLGAYIDKHGKFTTVKTACFRFVDKYIRRQYFYDNHFVVSYDDPKIKEPSVPFETFIERDYSQVDKIISDMKLTDGEKVVLYAYMSGNTYMEVTKIAGVNRTTVWRRRMKIKNKFIDLFS